LAAVRAAGRGKVAIVADEAAFVPPAAARRPKVDPRPSYFKWRLSNAIGQKQPGYFAVIARFLRGDVTAAQFRALTKIARDFSDGTIRTTNDQNVVIRFVAEADLPAIHAALEDAG